MGAIISLLISAVFVIVIAKVVFKSGKSVVGFLINTAVGALVLWVLNIMGLGLPINWITAGIVGLCGVPGVIIIGVLKYVFHLI